MLAHISDDGLIETTDCVGTHKGGGQICVKQKLHHWGLVI